MPRGNLPVRAVPHGRSRHRERIATGASRIGAAIGVYGAPHLLNYSVQLTMLVGAGVAGLGWLVTMLLAPETNGKLLTESSAVSQPERSVKVTSPVVADGGRAEAAL
jgi:putative MFS transporter